MLYLFGILTFLTSLFLILLILIQRGRGGGLVGALGGMGGQSAFGTKAGDRLTWVTFGVALFWIALSVGAIKVLNQSQSLFGEGGATGAAFPSGPSDSGKSDSDKSTTGTTDGAEKMGDAGGLGPATPSLTGGKTDTESSTPSTTKSATGDESKPPAAGTTPEKPPAEKPPADQPPADQPPAEAPDKK